MKLTLKIIIVWLVWTAPAQAQSPILTQTTPQSVNQGTTFAFSCASNCGAGGTWSVAGTNGSGGAAAAAGSIVAGTGVYTAPATVTVNQPYEGCQLLPNNDILNVRIDSLSVNANNAAWLAQANVLDVFFGPPDINHNVINNSVGTIAVTSTGNPTSGNGNYQILPPPTGKLQHGWYDSTGADHHYFTINTTTCQEQELYQPSGPGGNTDFTTVAGAIKYLSSSYTPPVPSGIGESGADVAGLNMAATMLHLQEQINAVATSGTIKHAMRFTAPNSEIHNGTGGLGTAFLWPAVNPSFSGFGAIPEGARARLKASYNISAFTAAQQIILTAWKQYGIILADGGFQRWTIGVDYDYWVNNPEIAALFDSGIKPTDFEFVDESGLMIASTSNECTCNREIVTYTSSTGTATVDVVLTGVTIGIPQPVLNIQAGAPVQTFTAVVHGTSNANVTWAMSPSVGTLTSGGVYTPPASVANLTSTTVTATSAASAAAVATMQVNIVPNPGGSMFLFGLDSVGAGNLGWPWPIVVSGNTWQPLLSMVTGGSELGIGSTGAPPWATQNTAYIYRNRMTPSSDMRVDIIVANGTYRVTSKFAESYWTTGGQEHTDPELNGTRLVTNLNVFNAAGGQYIAYDFANSVPIINGKLSYVLRNVDGFNNGLSALQIDLTGTAAATTISPGRTVSSGNTIK